MQSLVHVSQGSQVQGLVQDSQGSQVQGCQASQVSQVQDCQASYSRILGTGPCSVIKGSLVQGLAQLVKDLS